MREAKAVGRHLETMYSKIQQNHSVDAAQDESVYKSPELVLSRGMLCAVYASDIDFKVGTPQKVENM